MYNSSTLMIFKSVKYHQLHDDEKWRVDSLEELINIKFGKLELDNFVPEEIEEIIIFLSTS